MVLRLFGILQRRARDFNSPAWAGCLPTTPQKGVVGERFFYYPVWLQATKEALAAVTCVS